jgi:hypothetical protein
MAIPLEDELIKFIVGKRPLKLLFLIVAGVGLLSSAYKTVQPAVDWLQPVIYRLLDVKLDRADRQKYGCAYFSGGAQWNLPAAARVASSMAPETISKNLAAYQGRLSTCLNALGYPTPNNWTSTSKDLKELERAQSATVGALNSFAGSLQAKDRLTYLVHQIGNDIAFVLTQLEPLSPDERMSMDTALLPYEVDVARRLAESLAEAQTLCPCKLPIGAVKSENRRALIESSRELDAYMLRLFLNET